MAYEIKPYPEWSYSQSRDQLFRECLRKYYYHYYESHNGWLLESASPEQVTAYRLKQLTNLYLHFGAAVHTICENVVSQWQHKRTIPDYETLSNRLRTLLNQAYIESRDRQTWMMQPKRRYMLTEMYYDGELDRHRVETIKERKNLCLDNFLNSSTLKELTNSENIEVIELEQLNSIVVHDTKVYVKIDLLYKRGHDTWVIVDWKTGKEDSAIQDQLSLYALYVKEKYNVPLDQLELRTEYLLTGEQSTSEVSDEDLHVVLDRIERSMGDMKQLLDDEYWNRPKEISFFAPQPSPGKCKHCNFQEMCDAKYNG